MSETLILFGQLLGLTLVGTASSYLARKKGKNPRLWFFLGLLFGLIGILYLCLSKNKIQQVSQSETTQEPKLLSDNPEYKEKFWYYLDEKGKRHGPISFIALSQKLQEGIICEKTFIWSDALLDWVRIEDFNS